MLAAAMVGGEQLTLAWTFDAGETWTQYEAGGITGTKYNPSVVIRKRDGLWAVMTTGTSDDLRIFVSDDRGDSWSSLDQVATVVTDETHDKEHDRGQQPGQSRVRQHVCRMVYPDQNRHNQ